jgi:hypothetical protein
MASEKRRAYLKAYREKGGSEYRAKQYIAQKKHRAKYPDKTKELARIHGRKYREKVRRLILLEKEKMILSLHVNAPISILQF